MNEPETWKPVPTFTGYEASTHGNLRSYRQRGSTRLSDTPRPLKPHFNGRYLTVGARQDGSRKNTTVPVHRLIAMTFLPVPNMEARKVHHRDSDPLNNHVSNLFWNIDRPQPFEEADRHHVPEMGAIVRYIRSNPNLQRHFMAEISHDLGVSHQAITEAMRQAILHGTENVNHTETLQFNLEPDAQAPIPEPRPHTTSDILAQARARALATFYDQNPDLDPNQSHDTIEQSNSEEPNPNP